MDGEVDCAFYFKTLVSDKPTWRYTKIHINGPRGDGRLRTRTPPAIDDRIHLWDDTTKSGGMFAVRERAWLHSSFGSSNWPMTEPQSRMPPSLDVIVVKTNGLFVSEAIEPEHEDDSPTNKGASNVR